MNSCCLVNKRAQTTSHFLFPSLFSQAARMPLPWIPCLRAYPAFQAPPTRILGRQRQAAVSISLCILPLPLAVFHPPPPNITSQSSLFQGQSRSSTPSTMACDPATCPIIPGCETTIDISKGRTGLGLSIVGGCDTLLVKNT